MVIGMIVTMGAFSFLNSHAEDVSHITAASARPDGARRDGEDHVELHSCLRCGHAHASQPNSNEKTNKFVSETGPLNGKSDNHGVESICTKSPTTKRRHPH